MRGVNRYLKTACDYVHLNPVRAGLLKSEDRLIAFPWSSFGQRMLERMEGKLGEHHSGKLRKPKPSGSLLMNWRSWGGMPVS